ncbi:tyrosine-type recombinase/integrase [Thioclava electrotropha]|uniref:Tyrosine-type recombinase/integrase n=1 Tax=Thioclava electrotropha TaxID=1549850 RepID=A0ABX6YVQ9_9RHOB|nr:tyrosine-type recombinase/integrase [Thioclava electrotropha]QPZ91942.1 tyrosine-type recombinase/integrase [Thioclava electrotropha]
MSIMARGKGEKLYLVKRVPTKYASVESRKTVWISLDTDSKSVAGERGGAAWRQQVSEWEALLACGGANSELKLDAARTLAGSKGFDYLSSKDLLAGPVSDIIARVEAISMKGRKTRAQEGRALLGTLPDPGQKVSRALELFWELTSDEMRGKSEDQVRRARNPVIKAVKNFIEVIGDKPIHEITRDDMLDFRQWWADRLEREGLTANSANKDLTYLGKVLKRVNELKRLKLDLPLGGLSFKEDEAELRPPFSSDWIRNKLLANGALAGLNVEARCVLIGMINTGYRPSEGAALLPQHIRLEGAVPYVMIRPEGRQLKTRNAKRDIPLAGVSLDALRECRNGFPRYRDKPGLSATINKFLRENGLRETEDHVLYSLRHSFEDRLLAAGVDERVRRDLMGHALDRERYGAGASLEMAHTIIQRVAF